MRLAANTLWIPYEEHKDRIDKIVALLPSDFKDGMENWGGRIEQHIADTNYGLLLWDLIEKRDTIVLATDLDGDRLTDLLADVSDPLRDFLAAWLLSISDMRSTCVKSGRTWGISPVMAGI